MPDAQPVLKDLSARFEIFIATQAMAVPNSLGPKYRWLQRHFPFIPPTHYVFCGNKSILRADYLIDDQPRNLLRFEGQGLLYTAPHNLTATGFVRVNNWREVADYFARNPFRIPNSGLIAQSSREWVFSKPIAQARMQASGSIP